MEQSKGGEPRSGRGSIVWPVAVAALIFFASERPVKAGVFLFEGFDKVLHFSFYGLLATLVLRSRQVWSRGPSRGWIAVAVVSLYGISDEFHQSFTPGRSVEFADWIADTLGATVAVCAYLFWDGYRSLLEKPLWGRRRNPATVEATIGRK